MNKYMKLVAGLLMCASVTAQAAILDVSGHTFDDRGTSVVDQSTHLEWMDFSATMTRTTCSLVKDAGAAVPAGCFLFDGLNAIDDAAGWRLATRAEAAQLLGDWFGVPVGLDTYGSVSSPLSLQFLDVFAGVTDFVRPNFAPDTSDPAQAVGFFVNNGGYNMNFYNGDINSSIFSTALVRAAAPVNAGTVPEPGSLALLALALTALLVARRRRV